MSGCLFDRFMLDVPDAGPKPMKGEPMHTLDSVSQAYLIAGLSLERHVEGFVDSYHGPDDLKAEAEALDTAEALQRLRAEVDAMTPSTRRAYLLAQTQAMEAVARIAAGDNISYRKQVTACFGIDVDWVDEAEFEAAHYALDQLLPGSGSIAARQQKYRASFEIDNDRVLPLANEILADLRARTSGILPLPDGESMELRLVSGQPWSGYNWYLGNMASRIEINTDKPVRLNDLPDLLAHEAYPGHHTEHSVREQTMMHEQGFGEFAIALLISPQAVVSEGIATNALDMVVPQEDRVAWLQEHVYGPAGMTVDVEADLAIRQASQALGTVRGNAALMIHEYGRPVEDAVEHIVRYELRSEEDARRSMAFLTHPLFRTYIYTYTAGYDLVRNYLQSRGTTPTGVAALFTEHWTPARLRGSDTRRSSDDERLPL